MAASVRARSMAQRRVGAGACRRLASASGLQEALAGLSDSVYGEELAAAESLAQAQRATRRTVLWQLRVLAGWVPAGGTRLIRAAAAAFEADNILALDRDLRRERTAPATADDASAGGGIGAGGNSGLAGGKIPSGGGDPHPLNASSQDAEFDLGGLATAWPRVRTAGSVEELRAGLASSPWGDPGPETGEADILTMVWLRRLASEAAAARPWAASAGVLICARLLLVGQAPPAGHAGSATQVPAAEQAASAEQAPAQQAQRELIEPPERLVALLRPLLGTGWIHSNSVESLRAALPPASGQALEGVGSPAGLWRAEAAFAAHVETDGFGLLRAGLPGPDVVLGAMAVLAADAWRVRAALAAAAFTGAAGTAAALTGASAGGPSAATGTSEVLDAVA